jgi:hypothetical protein
MFVATLLNKKRVMIRHLVHQFHLEAALVQQVRRSAVQTQRRATLAIALMFVATQHKNYVTTTPDALITNIVQRSPISPMEAALARKAKRGAEQI